jgi:hypothetical protein
MKTVALVVVLCACGSDTKTKMDAPASSIDAPKDARPIDSPVTHPDAPLDGPPGTQQLIVKNYLNWCSVTANGGTATTADQQIVFVTPGTYTLTATKASAAFTIGPKMWHHTDGDTANMGEDGVQANGTSTAMVTVGTAIKCVWVCCPFSNGTGCSGIPDQCQ